jgi:hypothetical protein
MTKQLYEEALADVKKIKEIAEANAQHAVLEAVTPRIRDFIESELLREAADDYTPPGLEPEEGDLLSDQEEAISEPDEEGKVTLDLDALNVDSFEDQQNSLDDEDQGEEYEMNLESINALMPVLGANKKNFDSMMTKLDESVKMFCSASKLLRETNAYEMKLSETISRVEDMYDYVQTSMVDSAKKSSYETKLESYFKELNTLQENKMSYKRKQLREEDVTLKLTGLPDDVDLDSVGVDLITGVDDEGSDDDDVSLDLDDSEGDDSDDDSGDDSDEVDLGDLDLGGDDDDDDSQMESRKLSDNTIVEVDERMLRNEISRMRRLREEAVPSVKGSRPGSSEYDDFGDASAKGEPLDQVLREEDEDLEESDQLDEMDDEEVSSETTDVVESLRRRRFFESRLQARARSRVKYLKTEASKPSNRNPRRQALLKREYTSVVKRFNESLNRSKKLVVRLNEALSARQGRSSNGRSSRLAEKRAVNSLRSKLAETNLINAKLLYTNKLLQSESLSARQKAQVIQQLDSATTLREAKLVYESMARSLAGTSRSLKESSDRKVRGSSSGALRTSSSTQVLSEGYESERWARLAGINK